MFSDELLKTLAEDGCQSTHLVCPYLVVSCVRLVSLLFNYVSAVFYYFSDYPVYLSACLFS